ncbi:MAG: 2,3-bisphosphoglycerate-independent phosphoglycerate mutase [Pseudomonadota bacterium]
MTRPVVLAILDGWGMREAREANAVALAETPNFDRIWKTCPHTTLAAHGPPVGLPEGQMGNSEVGHMNIGAGRVVWMDLPRIDNAIGDGSFGETPALKTFIARLRDTGGTAHLMGLASPGGVHCHQRHIAAAARELAAAAVPVLIHAITDGRDVAPKSAETHLSALVADLPEGAQIASVVGRFYAMDRDNRWERVREAFDLVVSGKGRSAETAAAAVAEAYALEETDEFIRPTVLPAWRAPSENDGLFFLNFRADRAREILSALADPHFPGARTDVFSVGEGPRWAAVLGLVDYSSAHSGFMETMFPSEEIRNTLGAWVASKGLMQYRVAETEKYPHVTFFLNGGREDREEGEARHMAPSPKVRTYDLAPEMAAAEVTSHVVAAVGSGAYDLIVVNYANPDMVGHTGDLAAAVAACEEVDRGVGALLGAVEAAGGAMIVTADHGNCEMMVDPETGGPHTAHTLNPVPAILVGGPPGTTLRSGGKLGDLAPSLLHLMGIAPPAEMTGQSLIEGA